jgi:hypothetical protein
VITIGCPSCARRLRLPAVLYGQVVQCPGCAQTFPATHDLEAPPERSIQEGPPVPPPRPNVAADPLEPSPVVRGEPDDGDVPCPYCGEYVATDSIRCRYCGVILAGYRGDGVPFWQRRDCEPHRGSWVQLLGVVSIILGTLSIFLCGLSGLIAVPLGVAAWVMSGRDLAKMEAGLMDPSGLTQTRTGRQCGILGVIFSLLCGMGYGVVFGLPALLRL